MGIVTDCINWLNYLAYVYLPNDMPQCWMHQFSGLCKDNINLLRRVVTTDCLVLICAMVDSIERDYRHAKFTAFKDFASYTHQEVLRFVIYLPMYNYQPIHEFVANFLIY